MMETEDIRNIYSHLGDEESRKIYADRLLFSLTGDRKYMTDVIMNTVLYQKVYGILENDNHRKYIASAGQWGKIMADLFWEFGFSGMIDNYATGSYRNLPLMSMIEFTENVCDGTVYIMSTKFHAEFCQMLSDAGIRQERIVDVAGMMLDGYHNLQYFDLPYLSAHRKEYEIFVDGGCYDGENSKGFAKWAGNIRKEVYAFEPDETNYKKCRQVLEGMSGMPYQLFQKGLWSKEGELDFCASADEGARVIEGGGTGISVTNLDAVTGGRVTFIKMDIEGAEYEALKGATNLIRGCRPKLAIAVYHKAEDIWKLPQLILSIQPEYTFYLRHYSLSSEETVLYAI